MDRSQRRALLRKAVKGCMASALTLVEGEPVLNAKVDIVLALCRERAPRAVVRAVLLPAIVKHPRCVHPEEPGSRALLVELFTYADYPKPKRTTTTLYRGTAGVDASTAAQGYFWTENLDTALAYAIHRAHQRGVYEMAVVEADVPDDDIYGCVEDAGRVHITAPTPSDTSTYEFIVLNPQPTERVRPVTFEDALVVTPRICSAWRRAAAAFGHERCPPQIEKLIQGYNDWLEQAMKVLPSVEDVAA